MRGQLRTDATHVPAAVRALNRLELVGETLRHALDDLAVVAAAWLRDRADPESATRSRRRSDDNRLLQGAVHALWSSAYLEGVRAAALAEQVLRADHGPKDLLGACQGVGIAEDRACTACGENGTVAR